MQSAAPPWLASESSSLMTSLLASLQEADERAVLDNSQLSEALLCSRMDRSSNRILVIEYSRNPDDLHQALMCHPDLEDCRRALQDSGLRVCLQTPSGQLGAKMFVHPDQYSAALEAIQLRSLTLDKRHVVVREDLEQALDRIVSSLPRRLRIRQKGHHRIELGTFQQHTIPLRVRRTFVDIDIPSSIRSTPSGGARVASTTDAHSAARNPRRAVGRRSLRCTEPKARIEVSVCKQ